MSLELREPLEKYRSSLPTGTSTGQHLVRVAAQANPRPQPEERITFAFGALHEPMLLADCDERSEENIVKRKNALIALCDQLCAPKRAASLASRGCLEMLLRHIDAEDVEIRRLSTRALELLARTSNGKLVAMSVGSELGAVLPRLEDGDRTVRKNMYEALLTFCSSAQVVKLLVALGAVPVLVSKSKSETQALQPLCLEVMYHTLKAHGGEGLQQAEEERATEVCISLLEHQSSQVRELAGRNLTLLNFSTRSKLVAIDAGCVLTLCKLLRDEGAKVRAAAAGALMGLTTEKSAKMQCIESGGLDRLVELLADGDRLVLLNSLKTLSNVVAHPQARQMLQADATVARLRELSETAGDRLLARSAKQALDLVLWRP